MNNKIKDALFVYDYSRSGLRFRDRIYLEGYLRNGNLNLVKIENCKDLDELGVAIAKLEIANPDDKVLMSVYLPSGQAISENVPLDRNLNFVKDTDKRYSLSLNSDSVERITIGGFDDEELASNIKSLFDDGDEDGLDEELDDLGPDEYDVINIWENGDDDEVGYEIVDENEDVVEEGTFKIDENNVFKYDPDFSDWHPKYLLMRCDTVESTWVEFKVPASFKIKNCHFEDFRPLAYLPNFDCEWLGKAVTCLNTSIHCHGVSYDPINYDDDGTLGSPEYKLYQYNRGKEAYVEVETM